MSLEEAIAKLLRMDVKTFRKHPNPRSGYIRLSLLLQLKAPPLRVGRRSAEARII